MYQGTPISFLQPESRAQSVWVTQPPCINLHLLLVLPALLLHLTFLLPRLLFLLALKRLLASLRHLHHHHLHLHPICLLHHLPHGFNTVLLLLGPRRLFRCRGNGAFRQESLVEFGRRIDGCRVSSKTTIRPERKVLRP